MARYEHFLDGWVSSCNFLAESDQLGLELYGNPVNINLSKVLHLKHKSYKFSFYMLERSTPHADNVVDQI